MPGLASLLPAGVVSTDPDDLRAHARDWTPLLMLRERRGDALPLPTCVARPRSTGEVATILRWADETRTPVVPFGGGSSVVGGAQAVEGCVSLDLRAMDGIVEIDEVGLTVTAQAGILGPAFETALEARGLTMGHFPQSFDISTLGGWLSARGAGQKSSRYGRVEEMLVGIEAVLAGGHVVRTPRFPSTAAGPDLARLFVGAEGTLGVITEATLRLHPAPGRVSHAAYAFESFAGAVEAARQIMRAGLRPAVVRAYDETDLQIAFRTNDERPESGALAVLRFEADALAAEEEAAAAAVLAGSGGKDVGAGLAEWWWRHRNGAVGTLLKVMFEGMLGETAVVDTMELSATWPALARLYEEVRAALSARADVVGCHLSHPSAQGACLYFTFVMLDNADDRAAEARLLAGWRAGMEATLEAGGTISHHHGVGALKAPWAARELVGEMGLLRAIKRALDPGGIMNPGKLGL